MEDFEKYLKFRGKYTEDGFWSKITKVARKAGTKVVYAAMLLYYVMLDENIPRKEKMIVIGALGYFIFPLDAIPDFIPMGFTDDLVALMYALKMVYDSITPEIEAKAKAKVYDMFGEVSEEDFQLFEKS